MNENKYIPHVFALCSLFVLGNTFVTDAFFISGFWCNFISFVLVICFVLLFNVLIDKTRNSSRIFYIISSLLCVVALFGAGITLFDFISFLHLNQMPQTNIFLLLLSTISIVIVFLNYKASAIYKFCLLVSIIGCVFFIICFIGGIKNFDLKNFDCLFEKPTFTVKNFIKNFLPILVIPAFLSFEFKKLPTKSIVGGVVTGFFVLFLCFFQTVLSLGSDHNISFPYLTAIGIISSGSLFTRLDGLIYFLFFIACITRVVVCLKFVIFIFTRKFKSAR